jgi:phosphatidate cytidylyltransferase
MTGPVFPEPSPPTARVSEPEPDPFPVSEERQQSSERFPLPPSTEPSGPAEDLGPAPSPGHGRAGRDLVAAIGVGVGLAAVAVASLSFRKEVFVALACVGVIYGIWELASAFAVKQIAIPVVPLAVGSVGMLISAFVAGREGLVVAFSLTAFGCLLWRVIDGLDGAVRDVVAAVFAAAYVPLLAGFAMVMLSSSDGAQRVAVFVLVTVASDVGGYVTGVFIGRRPLAPSVSPKKSWEGLAGSVTVSVLVGALSVILLLHGPWWVGALVGAAAAMTATLGDLSESLIKRDLGVKDMGTLLPGHGGLMDRLDSLLPTAPVVYLLLTVFIAAP